ncbi:MAG: amidohydrolase family protein [Mycobacterium sp.]
MCQSAKDGGWSILVHCQGDAAVDEALDAIEAVYGPEPLTGVNRVEHATMARRDQIDRMKELGVEPSFIPDFIYLYGGAFRDQIFGFSLHSDAPATGLPTNPLRHLQTAVTCVTPMRSWRSRSAKPGSPGRGNSPLGRKRVLWGQIAGASNLPCSQRPGADQPSETSWDYCCSLGK